MVSLIVGLIFAVSVSIEAQSLQQHRLATHQPNPEFSPQKLKAIIADRIVARILQECGTATSFAAYCLKDGGANYGFSSSSLIQVVCNSSINALPGAGIFAADFVDVAKGLGAASDQTNERTSRAQNAALSLLDALCGFNYNDKATSVPPALNITTTVVEDVKTVAYPVVKALKQFYKAVAAADLVPTPAKVVEAPPARTIQSWAQFVDLLTPALNMVLASCARVAIRCSYNDILCFAENPSGEITSPRRITIVRHQLLDKMVQLAQTFPKLGLRNEVENFFVALLASSCPANMNGEMNYHYVLQTPGEFQQTLTKHATGKLPPV